MGGSLFHFIKISGVIPKKIFEAKNMQNLAWFWTTSDFGGKYLRNGWRYSKLDWYIFTVISPVLHEESLVNFGSLTTEI